MVEADFGPFFSFDCVWRAMVIVSFRFFLGGFYKARVMVKKQNIKQQSESGVVLQVNLVGAVVFSLALVFAAGIVTLALVKNNGKPEKVAGRMVNPESAPEPAQVPPWGELIVRDIKIQPPEEYLAFELQHITPPEWVFDGLSVNQVRQVMLSSGLTPQQVDGALMASKVHVSRENTTVMPDNELVMALSPEVRAKLYHELAHGPENQHMRFPFTFSGNAFEETFATNKVSASTTALVKKLMYSRGQLQCFSDYELVLLQIGDKDEQMRLLRAISSESAVMAGVRIRPDTDIDKLLGYWAWPGGMRTKDVQPLLESMKNSPDGRIGLVYLLPQFARQRLYTFPMPSRPGDPAMDCHWSTMNFFNEVPDDHFTDPAFTVKYIEANYYQIAKVTKYGDIILFMDGDSNNAIHSAVYLADDIVFTKNGNNM